MKKATKNKILEWFMQEGAIQQEENLHIAERAFLANRIINLIKEYAKKKKITPDDVEKNMKMVKLFLQKKVDVKWDGNMIQFLSCDEEKNDSSKPLETKSTMK